MTLPVIIGICVGGIVFLFCLFIAIGKLSAHKKKVMHPELVKKLNKIKKGNKHHASTPPPEPEKPKDEFILTQDLPKQPKKVGEPLISDYDEFEETETIAPELERKEESEVKRKSFDELLKARATNKNIQPKEVSTFDDDFDKFRSEHSIYTSYAKDDALIQEIQGLSPELKAVVFGNLFKRIDHDK